MLVILTSHPIQYQAPLWRALARSGKVPFEVWFLTDHAVKPTTDREFGKSFAWDLDLLGGYPHRFLPIQLGWRMDRFRGIRVTESWSKLFKQYKVTRLWVEGWRFWENWAAIFAARRAGIEVWLRGETNDLTRRQGMREQVRRLLLGQLFRCVSRFLCIGAANRRFYRSFGIGENRLLAAPYCVDNEWFAARAAEVRGQRSEVRRKWGIPEDAFCVLFCGKFIPKKRPMDLVEAARLLYSTNSTLSTPHSATAKLHLLFVGSGELAAQLRKNCDVVCDVENQERNPKAAIAGIPDTASARPRATFTGFLNQSELPVAYVAADCLVLPSDAGETWGLVVNEALATGLPCIASNLCGCAEDLVRPLSSAGVFPVGDVAALARAIEDQITHPVSETAVKCLVAEFAIERTITSITSQYPDERH